MKHSHALSVAAGLLLALVLSCGDEEEDDKPLPPPGPASLTIAGFIGASSERYSREEANEIRLDCSGLLAVELSEENWLFRPPGNCGATPQCGPVAIIVDDLLVEASTKTVVVQLGENAAGPHRVRAELRSDDHSAFIGDAGTPVADELDITVSVLPCPDTGMGGAAGQGGSPGSAGAGAGGAGGVSASAGAGGDGLGGNGGAETAGGQGGAAGHGGASAGAGGS